MATDKYTFYLGGLMPVTIPKPEARIKQTQALIDKYLKPKIEIEKISFKIMPEDLKKFVPYLIGIAGFILLLRLIK